MKRVLVVINKLLFGVGLESLLSDENDLDVKSIPYKNEKTLSLEIKEYEPDVVLIDESIKLAVLPNYLNILAGLPKLRLLVVNSKENRVHIYDKNEIQIDSSMDFLTAVKN